MDIKFGKTAKDYARHRQGFPSCFFDKLVKNGTIKPGDRLIDLGSGTGTLARGFAHRGCIVTGIDPAPELLEQARQLALDEGCMPEFSEGTAEHTGLESGIADVVTAGQCWHWFNPEAATTEIKRILKPGGTLIIAHFDWLPLKGNVVEATEQLIKSFNPQWNMDNGTGIYPEWPRHLGNAKFTDITTCSYDINAIYTPGDWRGRIRASAGIAASLSEEKVADFDAVLKAKLESDFPGELLAIPHRVFIVRAFSPAQ
ncbi:methyltransferase domain-containing protein [Parasalinivibrio latis]|uniref:class I SAM-dependent methyltransferase n=1 Tax=Parasalinivibrio latis TaxID=2952610 RepID=UPI0030E046C4